jgi:hypothetical protein
MDVDPALFAAPDEWSPSSNSSPSTSASDHLPSANPLEPVLGGADDSHVDRMSFEFWSESSSAMQHEVQSKPLRLKSDDTEDPFLNSWNPNEIASSNG